MSTEYVLFCVMCFADSVDGSWGHTVVETTSGSHCLNCGASGSGVAMPRWAVESVRKNASWVGCRYYPNQDDRERGAELVHLRALVPHFPGRTAAPIPDHPDRWAVTQRLADSKTVSVAVTASSEDEALAAARTQLPYVPA